MILAACTLGESGKNAAYFQDVGIRIVAAGGASKEML
jgi:hypothetical protein